MLLKEIMTPNVEVVRPDATVQEAATKMKALNVGSLPVCTGKRIQGMITDRDITTRAVAAGQDPTQTKVQDIMTPDLHYCFDDQPVSEAAGLMQRYQIRRLPIVNRSNELVGIVALGDIAVDVDNHPLAGTTLETVSIPSKPDRA
ncbi:MAG: CBS domain-containing protein [Caldilineaceae bacterium]|nr:CBS domain-containing protein [Caldilineaceae bacterium]MCB0124980.1 CBS domain-containing protein [Caldilineaceae bacterium]